MEKNFKNNWRMYGLNINGFQIIPCYYDLVRYATKLTKITYKLKFINFSFLWLKYRSIFDETITLN